MKVEEGRHRGPTSRTMRAPVHYGVRLGGRARRARRTAPWPPRLRPPASMPAVFWLMTTWLMRGTASATLTPDASSYFSSSPLLSAAPGPDVVEGFWSSPTVRRDLERFSRTCGARMGRHLDHWIQLYDQPRRVLTVEAACLPGTQNGLGNILGDFLGWFVWGIVTDRAVYIRWTDCADDEDADASKIQGGGMAPECPPSSVAEDTQTRRRPTPCRARANLAQYFQLPGGRTWGLTPATYRRIAQHQSPNGTGPTVAVAAPGDFPRGPHGLFGDGGVLMSDAAWVEVSILEGHGLVPHPTQTGDGSDGDDTSHRAWAEATLAEGYRRLARRAGATRDIERGEHDMVDFALVEGLHGGDPQTQTDKAQTKRGDTICILRVKT